MEEPPNLEVTVLLQRWSRGDQEALEQLIPLVYEKLRQLAASRLRAERSGHTLQPTALVNEAYLRLVGQKKVAWQNRSHFYGIAAQMMRRILVDHARKRGAAKREGGVRLMVTVAEEAAPDRGVELLALDKALTDLGRLDPRQAQIVELRFFGGLTVEETSVVARVSTATVKREWRTARAFLRREIGLGASS